MRFRTEGGEIQFSLDASQATTGQDRCWQGFGLSSTLFPVHNCCYTHKPVYTHKYERGLHAACPVSLDRYIIFRTSSVLGKHRENASSPVHDPIWGRACRWTRRLCGDVIFIRSRSSHRRFTEFQTAQLLEAACFQ